jgi:hypothetical protein
MRLFLMITVMVMLSFALTWSPQYDQPPGIGACYAVCAFTNNDEALTPHSPNDLQLHCCIADYFVLLWVCYDWALCIPYLALHLPLLDLGSS